MSMNGNGHGDLYPEEPLFDDQEKRMLAGISMLVQQEVSGQVNQLMARINQVEKTVENRSAGPAHTQTPAETFPNPQGPKQYLGMALLSFLNDPERMTQALSGLIGIFGQAQRMAKQGGQDDLSTLRDIQARNPVAFAHFTPDPFGGKFQELLTNAYLAGMRVRGGAINPLVNPMPSPLPAPPVGPSGPSSGLALETLSDDQLRATISGLLVHARERGWSLEDVRSGS